MAITTTNLGAINGTATTLSDRTALNLKTFSGEVLKAFDKKIIALPLVKNRTVSQTKSVQFPVTGALSGTTAHTPGDTVVPDTMTFNERVITIDQRYYKSIFLDDFEQAMMHFEQRGEIAKQIAEAIATVIDKAVFTKILEAADGTVTALAGTTQQDGQTAIVAELKVGAATQQAAGDALVAELFDIQASLNGRDVPSEGRTLVVDSRVYYALLQSTRGINQDFTAKANGGVDTGEIMNIAGFQILWTNHLPFVDYTVPVAGESKIKGLVFTADVMGVAKFMDVTSEANYLPKELGTLMTSYYSLGMGVLDPTSAVVITGE
jgi:hypothetical protein